MDLASNLKINLSFEINVHFTCDSAAGDRGPADVAAETPVQHGSRTGATRHERGRKHETV